MQGAIKLVMFVLEQSNVVKLFLLILIKQWIFF